MESMTLSIGGLCAALGISRANLHRKRQDGLIPDPLAVGGREPRWSLDEIRAWIAAGTPPASEWREKRTAPR